MTFDNTANVFSQVTAPEHPSPLLCGRNKGHVDTSPRMRGANKEQEKEVCYDEIEKNRWEDEGGAFASGTPVNNRDSGGRLSQIESQLEAANFHFTAHNIDAAVESLTQAALNLKARHVRVFAAMDQAILRLTTIDGCARPPHPESLRLIKLRRSLPV